MTQLHDGLHACGCSRSEPTIRRWLESDSIIGPKRVPEDIIAIQKATGDEELLKSLDGCAGSIRQLWSMHRRAARSLAEKVLSSAREWLDAGAAPDELVEIEDRLVLVTVESVDPGRIGVPRRILNQIQENTDD